MQSNTWTLTTSDQAELACYTWLPDDSEQMCGVLQITHGLAEHAQRYERLAKALTAENVGVYAIDLRGHGESTNTPESLGFFAQKHGWDRVVEDIHELNQHIHKTHPDLPVFFYGHSMGSLLGQRFLQKYSSDVAGAALSASVDNAGALRAIGAFIARIERLRVGARGKSKLLNAMSFGDFNKPFKPNRTEFDWLSRDNAEVDKYITDPKCGFIASTQLWIDLLGGLKANSAKGARAQVRKDLPLYLISGSKDPVTKDGEQTLLLANTHQKLGITDITTHIYPDGRHESLNETNRDQVTQDLVNWLKSKLQS